MTTLAVTWIRDYFYPRVPLDEVVIVITNKSTALTLGCTHTDHVLKMPFPVPVVPGKSRIPLEMPYGIRIFKAGTGHEVDVDIVWTADSTLYNNTTLSLACVNHNYKTGIVVVFVDNHSSVNALANDCSLMLHCPNVRIRKISEIK
jgi:hypothetical protein